MIDFEKFLKVNGIRQVDIVEYLGVSKGFVSQVINGKAGLSPQNLSKLLLNDKGWDITPLVEDGPKVGKMLPLIPLDAIAGYGAEAFSDIQVEEYYSIGAFREADFLIRVNGDSMSPKYCGGDMVACRYVKESVFFQWGRIYVIDTRSQGIMIKRVLRSSSEGAIICKSENEKYDDFEVPINDIQHIALVIGAITLE